MPTPEAANEERRWVEDNRAVLEQAFASFMESGEWPKVPILRRYFAQLHQDVDVQAVADSRLTFTGEVRTVHQEYVSLAIRHLRYLTATAPLINVCLVIARRGAVAYRTPDAELKVSSSDPEVAAAAEDDARLLARAGALLFTEQPSPLGGGGPIDDGWQYFVNESFVLDFENVTSADEFVAIQNAILESRHSQRQQSGYVAPAALAAVLEDADVPEVLASTSDESSPHPRAFISHASEDKQRFVTEFAVRLRANGIDAWVDRWEIAPGQSLVRRIFEEGIKDADAFIIVLSEYSINKPWVERELNAAVVENITGGSQLIPVVLDGVQPPVVLGDTLWVSINDLHAYDEELQRIVRAIFGVEERPPLGPIPGYIARPSGIRGLNPQDSQVLYALGKSAIESALGYPNYDAALAECAEAGLDEAGFTVSLEALKVAYLLKYQRSANFITELRLTQTGLMRYLEATRPDLSELRRRLIALLVNEFQQQGTQLEVLVERLSENITTLRVLVQQLENQHLLTTVRTFGYTEIMNISPLLARELT